MVTVSSCWWRWWWCSLVIMCLHCYCYCADGFPTDSDLVLSNNKKRVSLSIFLGLFSGFATALFVAALIRFFLIFINTTPLLKAPVVFSPTIHPTSLKLALDHKHLLSSTYYTTALHQGLTIAVKTLDPFHLPNKAFTRKLQQHLELLASLRHPHLMTLRAYVPHSHTFSLVYDYMPLGSLEDAISKVRQNQLQMAWPVRLRVAVGIIEALKFLHFDCHPPVLHYNLKPSNVILGDEFYPKLTDFGLPDLMPKLYRSSNGYRPPDLSQNGRYTDKSDVFSFGVILAVLLTGRDPLDPILGEGTSGGSIGRWLRQMQQAGEARKVLDKNIMGQDDEEEEMLMAVRIAVVCMSELPEDRPSADELVPMLSRLHSF